MSTPIYDYLAAAEGNIWSAQDTAYVRSVFRQVEMLAEELVAKARKDRTPDLPRCSEVSTSRDRKPCRQPANSHFGLCHNHFYQYFGHRFPWNETTNQHDPCSQCGIPLAGLDPQSVCSGRSFNKRAEEIYERHEREANVGL